MTEQTTEAETSTTTTRPVRVPNVSHGALSGLGHDVIGAAAGEAYDATAEVYDGGGPDDDIEANSEVVEVHEAPEVAADTGARVEGTQSGGDASAQLTGSGDPTNGALPTTDTYTVGDYTVEQVNDYLDEYPSAKAEVLAAEKDGQARVGILHGRHGTPKAED